MKATLPSIGLASCLLAATADATDHRIALSAPWPSAAELAPGDRILLEPGLHDPRTIEDWPGTAGMPIVITSADDSIPSALAGIDAPALLARGCGGLRLERLLVIGEGLDLEGTGRDGDSGIQVDDVQFLPASREPGAMGPTTGIRIAHTSRAELSRVGVRRWKATGVQIEDSELVVLDQLGLVGAAESPVAIRLVDCGEARMRQGGIVGAADAGIIVVADLEERTSVAIDRVVFQQVATPVRVIGPADVRLDHATIVQPTTAVVAVRPTATPSDAPAPPEPPSGGRVRLEGCLTIWRAGSLQRLFSTPADSALGTAEITLGENLWWSDELAAAADMLGGFPGGPEGQIRDVDPRLVARNWTPTTPEARRFGHAAPPEPSESGE